MGIKHLIMVSLLLAILTIGAASAADDIASDDLAPGDDVDVIAEDGDGPDDDGSDYDMWFEEDPILTRGENYDSDGEVVGITLPNTTDRGDDELFSSDVPAPGFDEGAGELCIDDGGSLCRDVLLKNLNLENVKDEDLVCFALLNDDGVADDDYFEIAKIDIAEDYIQFTDFEEEPIKGEGIEIIANDNGGQPFKSIVDWIFRIMVPEDYDGFVNIFVNDTQVGGNISLDWFYFFEGSEEGGRKIILNSFNIAESGSYDLRVILYDAKGNVINATGNHVQVITDVNTVTFNDAYYTGEGFLEFNLGMPVVWGDFYSIQLNGEEAGFYDLDYDKIFLADKFVDIWGKYAKFLKVGDYKVEVYQTDGETKDLMASGNFSILSLNVTADREIYPDGQNVTISFDGDIYSDKYGEVEVRLIKGWGLMGPEYDVIAEFDDDELSEIWEDGTFTINLGTLPVGTNQLWILYRVADTEKDFDDEKFFLDARDLIEVTIYEPVDPKLTISIPNIEEGSPAVVTVTTDVAFTGNVTVIVGTASYNVSVVSGKGTLSIPNLAAGTYNATAIFTAVDTFVDSNVSTTFEVSKKDTPDPALTPASDKKNVIKLTLKKVKVKKSAKKLVIKATLKINGKPAKGKKLKFKFNKKTYKAKTNKKGVAKITIKKKVLKKLKVGKKVKYQVSYDKKTVKRTVKVKK